MAPIQFRRYEAEDVTCLQRLDEWALDDTGTDPNDIPGSDDLADVSRSYLDTGGDFVVGVIPVETDAAETVPPAVAKGLTIGAEILVAMGGFLPSESGYADERTVPGAAELHRMRVAPPLQGRGYGTELLDALESRVRGAGFPLVLATTSRRQVAAIEFYKARGYKQVGESRMGEYDLVHFEKRLD